MAARALTFALLTLFVIGCSDGNEEPAGPSGNPESAVVRATPQLSFDPGQVTIAAGETVTWEFGSLPHNVFFDDAAGTPPDIPGFNSNTSLSRTFEGAGIFGYECRIHPGMRGTVEVEAGASSAGTTTSGSNQQTRGDP